MNWFAIGLFVAAGAALIVWRRKAAYWQGMVAGGRLHPGCAVAEGVAFIVLAIVFYAVSR